MQQQTGGKGDEFAMVHHSHGKRHVGHRERKAPSHPPPPLPRPPNPPEPVESLARLPAPTAAWLLRGFVDAACDLELQRGAGFDADRARPRWDGAVKAEHSGAPSASSSSKDLIAAWFRPPCVKPQSPRGGNPG